MHHKVLYEYISAAVHDQLWRSQPVTWLVRMLGRAEVRQIPSLAKSCMTFFGVIDHHNFTRYGRPQTRPAPEILANRFDIWRNRSRPFSVADGTIQICVGTMKSDIS